MKIFRVLCYMSILVIYACGGGGGGGGGSSSSDSVPAPNSLAGKTYNFTIQSGAGILASNGTWTVQISSITNSYSITGDVINVVSTVGTFTYTTNGNQGIFTFDDSGASKGTFIFTFTSSTSGTYESSLESDPTSNQKGTFIEQ